MTEPSPEPLEIETTVTLRTSKAVGAAWGSGLASLGTLIAAAAAGMPWIVLPALALAGLTVFFARRVPGPRRARARIGRDGVSIDGALVLPRASIQRAWVVPPVEGAPARVELGEMQLDVASVAEGEAVLAALELSAAERTLELSVLAPASLALAVALLGTMPGGFLMAISGQSPGRAALGFVLFAIGLVGYFRLATRKLVVGADGIFFARAFGGDFVPWSEITGAEPTERGITVDTRSGRREVLLTQRFKLHYPHERAERAMLLERIREAREAHGSAGRAEAEARLSRDGRTLEDWVRALADLGGGFREAPVVESHLYAVLESALAEPTARAAAAYVLGRKGTEEKTRVRIAAEACADQKLRVALERAASGESEEEMREALGEVEALERAQEGERGAIRGR